MQNIDCLSYIYVYIHTRSFTHKQVFIIYMHYEPGTPLLIVGFSS